MKQLVLAVLLLATKSLFAQNDLAATLSYLAPADRDVLLKENAVKVFSDRFENLTLWKGGPFEDSVRTLFAHRDSTLAAEALFLVPVNLPQEPAASDALIEKALTSVSTMKGLQVYSISLKRMETFIFDAYRTASADKKTKLPDPDLSGSSGSLTFTMFQNEEQTGESFSQYTFVRNPKRFLVTQTNLTSLNYGIVPLVSPHDLLTAVYVVPFGDKILIYGVSVAKTISLFGLERSRTASLYARVEALVTWFTNNLKGKVGT